MTDEAPPTAPAEEAPEPAGQAPASVTIGEDPRTRGPAACRRSGTSLVGGLVGSLGTGPVQGPGVAAELHFPRRRLHHLAGARPRLQVVGQDPSGGRQVLHRQQHRGRQGSPRLPLRAEQGGAWGLLQDEPESIRRPFFLGISFLAIAFIVSLYRKLTPQQWALKWGLPLVLGGALGNLVNRVQFNYVVDFIDYRAGWVRWLNGLISSRPTDHWPTFNVADVAIVAGVVLMAVDMFTPRKSTAKVEPAAAPSGGTSERSADAAPASSSEDAAPPVSGGPGAPAPKET